MQLTVSGLSCCSVQRVPSLLDAKPWLFMHLPYMFKHACQKRDHQLTGIKQPWVGNQQKSIKEMLQYLITEATVHSATLQHVFQFLLEALHYLKGSQI